ncbi:dynamin family protein [Lapillicoccus sp.]|uniref:dynamin family protein n=1 Tax=Lapillicoccus sp. TaxID=1909287 RepID=UPI003262F699
MPASEFSAHLRDREVVVTGGRPNEPTMGMLQDARLLASDSDALRLDRLRQRLADLRLRVLVVGEAKRGKSTLVNALLGRDLLPTGVTPLTSVATTVTAAPGGQREEAVAIGLDGSHTGVGLAGLPDLVTERGNPDNVRRLAEVVVRVRSPLLDRYSLDLVDTPGTGSVFAHNTAEAHAAFTTLDAAVLVLTVDPPISQAERELLERISAMSLRTFVVLNKSDRLTDEEVDEAVRFTAQICAEVTRHPVQVTACSARRGGDEPGFAAFAESFAAYLAERSVADAALAVRLQVCRVIASMLDEARVRLRAVELADQGDARVGIELQRVLACVSARRRAITDRCAGSVQRLRRDLDGRAAAAVREITRRSGRDLEDWWPSQAHQVPVDDLERVARAAAASMITRHVEAWRATTVQRLEAGLATIATEGASDVNAQLRLASDAVERVLDLTLSARADVAELPVNTRFRYDYTPATGWDPPLRGTLSRLATSAHRRARIRRSVGVEAVSMVDRQVGRARADLQDRLREAAREVSRALEEQCADTLDRLSDLTEELARDASGLPGDNRRSLGRELAARVDALKRLQHRCDEPRRVDAAGR